MTREELKAQIDELMRQYADEEIDAATYSERMMELTTSARDEINEEEAQIIREIFKKVLIKGPKGSINKCRIERPAHCETLLQRDGRITELMNMKASGRI